jgi:DNA-directed RNA polymerase specialized sigma24 family protein
MPPEERREAWPGRVLREGDAEAVLLHFLRSHSVAHLKARQLVPDALQEGLLYVQGVDFNHWTSYRHYLHGVVRAARNHLISLYRRGRRGPTSRQFAEGELSALPDPHREPDAVVRFLKQCLDQLPKEDREFILRLYKEGLNLREMAERLPPDGRTPQGRISAIFRRRRAILDHLREALLKLDPEL